MKDNHQLALIVAYYLSRADKQAYESLGFKTFSEAVKGIGDILGVKVNTIKNMRDEFDPYHGNSRVGWLRELRGSRLKVLRSFQDTDDETLLEIVKAILFDQTFRASDEYREIESLFTDQQHESTRSDVVILRAPTGRKAEEFFIDFYKENQMPVKGELTDKRDQGCGYDFDVLNDDGLFFVEVKGLAAESGGVLFTNKEWLTAIKHGNNYFLALIRNLAEKPTIDFIRNPAVILKPKKNIYTTVQLNWSVSERDLNNIDNVSGHQ